MKDAILLSKSLFVIFKEIVGPGSPHLRLPNVKASYPKYPFWKTKPFFLIKRVHQLNLMRPTSWKSNFGIGECTRFADPA